ncbi:hypothetical protein H681_23215 [Pseudomonas sp. ATCC 13867]|nr:hypothetical protein H681_23215 [Pseudomonas sp. ATCC 13867]
MATNNLWNGAGFKIWIARVFPLRRIDEEDIFPYHQAALLNAWQELFFRSARIGGALQRNDLACTQIWFECVGRIDYEAHIRFTVFVQRSRNAENQCIALGDTAEVVGRGKSTRSCSKNLLGRYVLDIALARIEHGYFAFINVDAEHIEANCVVTQHQR